MMTAPPDLRTLTEVEKDALIRALWAQVQTLTTRVAELEARLNLSLRSVGNGLRLWTKFKVLRGALRRRVPTCAPASVGEGCWLALA